MGSFEKVALVTAAVLASVTIYGSLFVSATSDPIKVQAIKQVNSVKSDPYSPNHAAITDMLENYIETHHEKKVSRTKLLKYVKWVNEYTVDHDFDPIWVLAMMWQESRFLEKSKSPHGAIGLLQVLPSTAESFDVNSNALISPEINIKTSIRYLLYLLDKYDGNLRIATIAYNQGEGNVDKGKARSWYYNSVKKHHIKMTQILERMNKKP